MGIRAPLVMSLVLIAGMLAVTAWAWPLIPDTARIATHWGANNVPNGFMRKDIALLFGPACASLVTAIFAVALFIAKRDSGLAKSSTPYVAAWLGTLVVFLISHVLIILYARGYKVDMIGNLTFLLALVFIVVGNLLGKTRPNPLVGVRTPWTRKSDYAWDKTNRAAGRMMVGVGLVTLLTFAAVGSNIAISVLVVGMLGFGVISIPLSYYYWRRDPARRD